MTEVAGKRLQLLHEVVPNLRRLAVLFDVGYSGSELQMRAVQTAAHRLGVKSSLPRFGKRRMWRRV